MGRKNNRMKTEYHKGLGFDPRKYLSEPTRRSSSFKNEKRSVERTPMRGDIWYADLGSHPYSSVQSGCRPVVVISNNIGNGHSDTVNILPLTRHLKKPDLPCHTELYPDNITDRHQMLDISMILAEQITTIGKDALRNYVGRIVDAAVTQRIDHAVAVQLGLALERSAAECL